MEPRSRSHRTSASRASGEPDLSPLVVLGQLRCQVFRLPETFLPGAPVWTSTPRARRRSRKLFACVRREQIDERTGRPCSASRPGCSPGISHALAILWLRNRDNGRSPSCRRYRTPGKCNFLEYRPIVMTHLDAERTSNAPSRAVLPVAHALRVEATLTDNQASKILGRHPRIVAAGYDTSVSSFTDQNGRLLRLS